MRSSRGLTLLVGLFVVASVVGARTPPAAAHGNGDRDHGRDRDGDRDRDRDDDRDHGRDRDHDRDHDDCRDDDRSDGDRGIQIENVRFRVTLSDAHTYRIAGYVYAPRHPRHPRHRTVQLLVHGATYNHRYWDAPEIHHRRYSYAREMARRGYVVVSIDQLGAGNSDKPDGDFFSLADAASSLHQISSRIRAYGGHRAKLAYVGHSNGSVTSIYAQGTYADADLLVTTGWVHGFRGLPVDPTDPEVQAAIATPYINLRGPVRNNIMYYTPKADPAMIAYDTAVLTDSMPRRQFLDLIGVHADITSLGPGGMTQSTRSQLVRVPTLVQAGERDDHIAPANAGPPSEQAFYPLVQDFSFHTLPEMGHVDNLHVNHDESWDDIDAWLSAHE